MSEGYLFALAKLDNIGLSAVERGNDPSRDAIGGGSQAHPAIRRELPFGSDSVPARYQAAWQAMLTQCPSGVTPFVWEAAIYDAALLFGDFGSLLDEYRWTPGDLFDVPHDDGPGGLSWFIKGSPVVAIGRSMAQCQDGRIWRMASR